MNRQTCVESFDFSAVSLVGQAFRLTWENLWLFLWWCLPPLAVSVFTVWRDELFHGQAVLTGAHWPWEVVLPFLQAWLAAVSFIRVMRFVLLGERPKALFAAQLFEARTWRYLFVSVVVFIQVILMGVFTVGIPCYAAIHAAGQRAVFTNETQFALFLTVVFCLICGFGGVILAGRAVLFSPNIAVDGKSRLSRLGERSVPATRALVRTYLLVIGTPVLPFLLPLALIALGLISAGPSSVVFVKVSNTVNVLVYMVQLMVFSLAFQRLRPLIEGEGADRAMVSEALGRGGASFGRQRVRRPCGDTRRQGSGRGMTGPSNGRRKLEQLGDMPEK